MITRDSRYQLSDRLAFAWKLASLSISVALLYPCFAGDQCIRDAGTPFADDADRQTAFGDYASDTVPHEMLERRARGPAAPLLGQSRGRPLHRIRPPVWPSMIGPHIQFLQS